MNDFSPIPLVPEYSLSSSGRILPNGISIESVNEIHYMAVGTSDGELYLYRLGNDLPLHHVSSLGGIAIVKISWVSRFDRTVLIVISLESKCYFFDITEEKGEWVPLLHHNLIFNPSCFAIFQGKSGTEILIGTTHGSIGYFVSDFNKKSDFAFRFSHNWNLGVEITSIALVDQENALIGRGDGSAILFTIRDNPERVSTANQLTETNKKIGSYLLVSFNKSLELIATVNGFGRINFFKCTEGKLILMSEKSEVSIDKRPIFLDVLNINGSECVVVGTSDGCLYFLLKGMSNFFRYEEATQCYFIKEHPRPILVVVGQSGYMSIYRNFSFLPNKVPKFLDFASTEITDLRKIIGDFDTPADALVATYLYMPLPE